MDRGLWQAILEGYGQRVKLHGEEDREVRAFFQPIKEHKPGESPSPLGVGPRGLYLYLGPAGESLEGVNELSWDGRAFEVVRHRAVLIGEQVMYQWALCRELDEVRA